MRGGLGGSCSGGGSRSRRERESRRMAAAVSVHESGSLLVGHEGQVGSSAASAEAHHARAVAQQATPGHPDATADPSGMAE